MKVLTPEELRAQARADVAKWGAQLRDIGPITRGPARTRDRLVRGVLCRRGHDGDWLAQLGGFYCDRCRRERHNQRRAQAGLAPYALAEGWAAQQDAQRAAQTPQQRAAEWQATVDAVAARKGK